VPDGVVHAGPAGAGHFVKLIHNAIEFGMLQAIGEGLDLLARSDYALDLPALFHAWAHGSVIRGWLVEPARYSSLVVGFAGTACAPELRRPAFNGVPAL
jgi:6-phosphogluconate dehydrogenase (decarboxylating)